jgi:VWA-like domain (DUF2201)
MGIADFLCLAVREIPQSSVKVVREAAERERYMPALPPISNFTGSTVTEGQFKTALSDLRSYLAGLLGTDGSPATALITLGSLGSGYVSKTATYTVVASDRGRMIDCSGTFTLNLTAAATLGAGFTIAVRNSGTGVVTLDPSGAELIDGVATVTLASGEAYDLYCTGTAWRTSGRVLTTSANDTISHQTSDDLRRYWNSALQQASAVARRIGRGYGKVGLTSIREYEQIFQSELDWKHLLWEHIVHTPYDFSGFDRRFLHKKVYLEESVSEAIEIWICIDSSASVGSRQLGMFMAEIQNILDIYPQIQGKLFFADVELFGPYPFGQGSAVPPIEGGGGTSFVPFFERVDQEAFHGRQPICVYFTDGFGEFPPIEVDASVLWVVVNGGLESTGFPFGTVVRLSSSDSGELEDR